MPLLERGRVHKSLISSDPTCIAGNGDRDTVDVDGRARSALLGISSSF